MGVLDFWQVLALFQHELLLFAAVFFLIGAIDDIAIDLLWLWLRARGRIATGRLDRTELRAGRLKGRAAVFIPAWSEASVIRDTLARMLAAWPQKDLRIYVGCYRNDPATIAAAMRAAPGDARLRIVIHDRDGPSTKADCLNRLYRALRADERRMGEPFAMVAFHDAEDIVDPAALGLLDAAIARGASFVQLPVEPLARQEGGFLARHLGSHYCEEFAEAHGKDMVLRDALGAALPAAGVGCAVARGALELLCERAEGDAAQSGPFRADSLTEDYELGLGIAQFGGACRFVRARGEDGRLIATRAYFPDRLEHVLRQKTRWVHGIALQGWDRIGWGGSWLETWMRARDRRGPMTALVLALGYTLLAVTAALWTAQGLGLAMPIAPTPLLEVLLIANLVAFAWRAVWRFLFTASVYGSGEGLRAVLRIPLANTVAIIAGRRAVTAYARTLAGRAIEWDKTPHASLPTNPSGTLSDRRPGSLGAPALEPLHVPSRPARRTKRGSDPARGLVAS
ncbi:MAG: glycosyl transferase family protein [Erythrobacter sp.]|uniref:glycosyl transferase family protein n=1 Tax=Erythrobacter sp. TaxID=1042 RepID=UPI0032EE6C63